MVGRRPILEILAFSPPLPINLFVTLVEVNENALFETDR